MTPLFPAAARLPLSVLAAAGLLLPGPATAQVEDAVELAPMVVTATRTARTADETLASVTVVERAEIERRQSRTMIDILRGLPGVAITNNGGPGRATSVFLRGTNSDHTLVLVDGIKVGSATLGSTPWENLPVEQIERVEVVRGPRSSLYGSEAIGGVIQIFTRRGTADADAARLTPRFSVGGGTYNSIRADGGVAGSNRWGWFDAGLGFEQTAGFNACRGEPFVGGCFVDQPDRDGYTNHNGSLSAGLRLVDWLELDGSFLRSEGDVDFDGSLFAGNRSETVTQVANLRAAVQPFDAWRSILSVGRSWDESDIFFDDSFLNRFNTRRDLLGWQNDITISAGHLVTLGVDYQHDEIDTDQVYDEDSRDNTGLYGQYLGRLGLLDLQLSLRNDDNEQFGSHATGNGAVGYSFANGLRLTASYGTAFKAPSFNELYFPGFGNPDLDPEQSASAELGVSGPHPWGEWAVNLYQTEIDDLISFTQVAPGIFAPENVDEARIRGLEAWTTAEIAGWIADANLTLLDPRNRGNGPNRDKLLARRPEQTFRLDLDRQFGRIGVGGSLFIAGRRFDDAANDERLSGFTLIDLRAEYAFSDSLSIQGRIENLLDEDYETAAYYRQPGRTLFVTLAYRP